MDLYFFIQWQLQPFPFYPWKYPVFDLRQTLNINNANQTSVHYIQTVRSNHETFFFKCLVFCLHYTLCNWIKSLNSIKM